MTNPGTDIPPEDHRQENSAGGANRPADRPPRRALDVTALAIQIALTLLGLYIIFVGPFTIVWDGDEVLRMRQPLYGPLLLLLGVTIRWCLSHRFRRRSREFTHRAMDAVRAYQKGANAVPWAAMFACVVFPAFLVYVSGTSLAGGDTLPSLLTAASIVREGNLDISEYCPEPEPLPYYVTRVGDRCLTRFSLGPALIAVPFIAVSDVLGGASPPDLRRVERVIAALIAATTAGLMSLILLRLAPLHIAVALSVFFAFGTQNYMTAGQALWQHGPVALCVTLTLFIEFHTRGQPSRVLTGLQGALLGLAIACRPTAAIVAVLFALVILSRRPLRAIGFASGAILAYLPFFLVHVVLYDSALGPYAAAGQALKWQADLSVSVPGNLISPARGLLIYQPLFALAVFAFIPSFARRIGRALALGLGLWFVLHLLVVSRFSHWWGGHCWGPRFLTELMPALLILSIPVATWLCQRAFGRALLWLIIGWCVFVQAIAPLSLDWSWNPTEIDQNPERLWDWSHPPFFHHWLRSPSKQPTGDRERQEPRLTTGPHIADIPRTMRIASGSVRIYHAIGMTPPCADLIWSRSLSA